MEALGTTTFNVKKKVMTFSQGKTEMTIHNSLLRVSSYKNTMEEPSYESYEDQEKDVNWLNKILMDKDEEVAQIQEKLWCQELGTSQCQQQIK